MIILKKILEKFTGWHYPQEYLCLAREQYTQPLQACLVRRGKVAADITGCHLFVGYSPLVVALPSAVTRDALIDVYFFQHPQPLNANAAPGRAVACLRAEQVHAQQADGAGIIYYRGLKCRHRMLSQPQQWIVGLQNSLFNNKGGNVYLPHGLYKQVQVAYALPRTVSLITVGGEGGYNLFPTDLHGPAGANHYLISLRTTGKALTQVLAAGRLLLSEVEARCYRAVYSLGKNHMQPLKERAAFPFCGEESLHFNLPLPKGAVRYRELQLEDLWSEGIHTILLMKVEGKSVLTEGVPTLAHVHNSYATWRYKQGLESNYLLR